MNEEMLKFVTEQVIAELCVASEKFLPFRSEHEGVAVIEEEFLELRDAVFAKGVSRSHKYNEAIQLAAMAMRFVIDLYEVK